MALPASERCRVASRLTLVPKLAPKARSDSLGIGDAFVRPLKRDSFGVDPLRKGKASVRQLSGHLEDEGALSVASAPALQSRHRGWCETLKGMSMQRARNAPAPRQNSLVLNRWPDLVRATFRKVLGWEAFARGMGDVEGACWMLFSSPWLGVGNAHKRGCAYEELYEPSAAEDAPGPRLDQCALEPSEALSGGALFTVNGTRTVSTPPCPLSHRASSAACIGGLGALLKVRARMIECHAHDAHPELQGCSDQRSRQGAALSIASSG
ncbi:MAG: hypothetical protein AAF913_04575 [Pseudomonadota bacterium]